MGCVWVGVVVVDHCAWGWGHVALVDFVPSDEGSAFPADDSLGGDGDGAVLPQGCGVVFVASGFTDLRPVNGLPDLLYDLDRLRGFGRRLSLAPRCDGAGGSLTVLVEAHRLLGGRGRGANDLPNNLFLGLGFLGGLRF